MHQYVHHSFDKYSATPQKDHLLWCENPVTDIVSSAPSKLTCNESDQVR
jgi:hypothetical protein